MTSTDVIDVESIPPVGRSDAQDLAATEYDRLVEQLRALDGDDWRQPTDCPLWDVRAIAGHSVGMLSDFTSFRSMMRRMRLAAIAAKRNGEPLIDAMTAMQVTEHANLTEADLIARAELNGPTAARWRANAPRWLRRMPTRQSVGGRAETWRIGYLLDTILTRDPWMHRVDIARATRGELVLTADHDGRIIADVVAEWARRHGQPFALMLTGPAGGEFTAGSGTGEQITIDAVEFCRTLSGRTPGSGLLTHQVPF